MKKFRALAVTATSLFIIGMLGLIYFGLFVQKPLDNYFAFILILAVATLPKTLLEFFITSKNLEKNSFVGTLRLAFFFLNFSVMSDLIFPYTAHYSISIHGIIAVAFFLWGMFYYRKHPSEEKKSLTKKSVK